MIITIRKIQIGWRIKPPYSQCTNMKHQVYDLFDIAAFLGHRNIKNTDICFHLEKMAYPNGGTTKQQSNKNQTEALQFTEASFEMLPTAPDGTMCLRTENNNDKS